MIEVKDILAGEPINGHIVIRVDVEQIREDLGLPRDSKLILTEMQEKRFAGASSKGVVVKMATDAFGQVYKDKYGKDIDPPKIGDIVVFTPYQNAKMDNEGEYYMLTDDSIKFVIRKGAKK
jgi:hypothetical protein